MDLNKSMMYAITPCAELLCLINVDKNIDLIMVQISWNNNRNKYWRTELLRGELKLYTRK